MRLAQEALRGSIPAQREFVRLAQGVEQRTETNRARAEPALSSEDREVLETILARIALVDADGNGNTYPLTMAVRFRGCPSSCGQKSTHGSCFHATHGKIQNREFQIWEQGPCTADLGRQSLQSGKQGLRKLRGVHGRHVELHSRL
jgi:hypothetical protein